METNISNVIRYASNAHAETNQRYAKEYPYSFHLDMAANFGFKFLHLIPEEDWEDVLGGIWCHDLIEDTRQTYNDVKRATNEVIAEYSYALANEKGKNRATCANAKYYREICRYKHASFIKLCDRLANVYYSIQSHSTMLDMYKKEHPHFRALLYDGRFEEMWIQLETFINEN